MYISVGMWLDIAYLIGWLVSFLDCFRLKHWEAAIHVLRYLKGTRLLGVELRGSAVLHLVRYSDSDFVNCPDTSHSIKGYWYNLGSGVILWSLPKQQTVADSSCYTKYITLYNTSHKGTFLEQLLTGLHILPLEVTWLYCDNNAMSRLTKDHI
jgi:hypothetical protein